MANPWFRLYSEAVDDEKLRLLAFEDRWHFIAILCCKNMGLFDDGTELGKRKLAVKLGLSVREMDEVARRLSDVGLTDRETMEPLQWDKRQFKGDSSSERVKNWRDKNKKQPCNGDETLQKRYSNGVRIQNTDTDTDTDTDKNLCASSDADKGKPSKRFKHPTIEEVAAYCKERNNGIDPEYFIDSNKSRGWLVGRNKTPMKDWKATIRTWEITNKKQTSSQKTQTIASSTSSTTSAIPDEVWQRSLDKARGLYE
jgi:hypothetical protein